LNILWFKSKDSNFIFEPSQFFISQTISKSPLVKFWSLKEFKSFLEFKISSWIQISVIQNPSFESKLVLVWISKSFDLNPWTKVQILSFETVQTLDWISKSFEIFWIKSNSAAKIRESLLVFFLSIQPSISPAHFFLFLSFLFFQPARHSFLFGQLPFLAHQAWSQAVTSLGHRPTPPVFSTSPPRKPGPPRRARTRALGRSHILAAKAPSPDTTNATRPTQWPIGPTGPGRPTRPHPIPLAASWVHCYYRPHAATPSSCLPLWRNQAPPEPRLFPSINRCRPFRSPPKTGGGDH
jgi:hypothetical protein